MRKLLRRMIQAALLDADTYEEVEADHQSIFQAALVVGLASISFGLGTAIQSTNAGIAGVQGLSSGPHNPKPPKFKHLGTEAMGWFSPADQEFTLIVPPNLERTAREMLGESAIRSRERLAANVLNMTFTGGST